MRLARHRITLALWRPKRCRTSSCTRNADSGQATVEAAFALPVLMLLVLMLLQPAIVLYDRMVMQAAAAEGCRLLATSTSSLGSMESACEEFVRHRLGAIPQQDCFHVHDGTSGCSWDISITGNESSQTVEVSISGEIRPLPLLDGVSTLLGLVNERGNLVVQVSATALTQPEWAQGAFAAHSTEELVGLWLDD